MSQVEYNYIRIPYPKDPGVTDLHFKILVPTCSLVIAPGIGKSWVTGRYSDPKAVAQISTHVSGNTGQISTIGAFAYRTPKKYLPDMRLSFGRLRPFSMLISAGDLCDQLDFGGLPLTGLEIKFGANNQEINFSYENPQTLSQMKIEAGDGTVNIENLANAHAAEIRLNGDATHYQLNFCGELKQNTNLSIGTSVASVVISVAAATAIKISSRNALPSSLASDFTFSDGFALNSAARDEKEPLFTIHAPYSSLRLQYI